MKATQSKTGGDERRRNWWLWLMKVAAVAAVVFGLGAVLTWYGVRTPVVLSHLLGPQIAAEAADRDIELEIGAMGPAGGAGIRLHQVKIGVQRGGADLQLETDRIDVIPAVGRTLSQGRPVIRQVEVGETRLTVDHGDRDTDHSVDAADAVDVADAADGARPTPGLARWIDERVDVRVDRFVADVDEIGRVAEFEQVSFGVGADPLWPVDVDADGEIIGFQTSVGASDESLTLRLDTPQLEIPFDGMPTQVQLEAVSLSRQAIHRFVRTGDLRALIPKLHGLEIITGGDAMALEADESTITGDATGASWSAPTARFQLDGRDLALEDSELTVRRDTPGVSFGARIVDGQSGAIRLQGNWHLGTSLVEINAWFDQFHWDGAAVLPEGLESPVRRATVDGALHGDIDLVHRLVALDGDLHLENLTIDAPLVANDPVSFQQVELGLPITVDLSAGAFSVVGGTVGVEQLAPVTVDGRIVAAGQGEYVFELAAGGRNIDVAQALERLPDELTGVAAETVLAGTLGVDTRLHGHTAFPESLRLEVQLDGDRVEVIEDIQWGAADGGDEVRLFDPDAPGQFSVQGQWVDIDALPPHISQSVLAAEDTTFFDHDGVDWDGLEMALEQNLEEGQLVRGGSTITQQVAKNLFLTHDRTLARKLQEAFLTWRLEQTLTKQQILELYLNVVEWGPDVRGLYAASHYFFDAGPEELNVVETVMLASILPSPIRFGGAVKQDYLPSSREDKMRRVLENMRFLDQLDWPQYHAAVDQLDDGRLGRRSFQLCADDDTAPDQARDCDDIEVTSRDGEEMTFETWEVADADHDGWAPLRH